MSEITLFKNGNIGLPSHFQGVNSNLAEATFANSGGGRSLSIRGGKWRLIVDGKEVGKKKGDTIQFVIVGMSERVGRTLYEGAYEVGKEAAPICWSPDGQIPSPESDKVQANSCDECPSNIKGSGQGETKACRYTRYLAVVLPNDLSGDVYKLALPATSIFGDAEGNNMPFDAYRRFLAGHKVALDWVVTEAKFDDNSSTPKLFFNPVRPLEKDEFDAAQEQGRKEETKKLVAMSFKGSKSAKRSAPTPDEPPKKAAPAPGFEASGDDDDGDGDDAFTTREAEKVVAEEVEAPPPVKRSPKKKAPSVPESPKTKLDSILDDWETDED